MASSVIKNFGTHCEIIPCSMTITLPSGQSSTSTTTVDFSSHVPTGRSVIGIVPVQIGNYPLPYSPNGTNETYVYNTNLQYNLIYIRNRTSTWDNYIFKFLIILAV